MIAKPWNFNTSYSTCLCTINRKMWTQKKCKQESKHKTHRTANYGLQTACRMPLILYDPASHVKNTQKAAYECICIAYFKEFSDYMSF